jgi:hypothetical protein
MKQETKHIGFFEHLLGPGHAIESFRADISDLKVCNPREWTTTCVISKSSTSSCGLQEQHLVSDASTSLLHYVGSVAWFVHECMERVDNSHTG